MESPAIAVGSTSWPESSAVGKRLATRLSLIAFAFALIRVDSAFANVRLPPAPNNPAGERSSVPQRARRDGIAGIHGSPGLVDSATY